MGDQKDEIDMYIFPLIIYLSLQERLWKLQNIMAPELKGRL